MFEPVGKARQLCICAVAGGRYFNGARMPEARVSNVARGGLRVRPSQTQQLIELYHSSVRYHSLNG
jgi:hypothetical protein